MNIAGSLRALKPIVKSQKCQVRKLGSTSSSSLEWSNTLSFSSPESDFAALTSTSINQTNEDTNIESTDNTPWSRTMSFASPESDFSASDKFAAKTEWSDTMSFASPESDFSASDKFAAKTEWSDTMSFASPESDFSASDKFATKTEWSNTMSFASPESDFTSSQSHVTSQDNLQEGKGNMENFIHRIQKDSHQRDTMAYSLSFTGAENDVLNPTFVSLLDERMKKQLDSATGTSFITTATGEANDDLMSSSADGSVSSFVNKRELEVTQKMSSQVTLKDEDDRHNEILLHPDVVAATLKAQDIKSHEAPLPQNLQEATQSDDTRPIVVTEAQIPFTIVSVNPAWEELCGYTALECRNQTLACIQGPETNKHAVTALMSQLMKGEEAGTLLTNYSKSGRKFHNRLRVGPLKDHNGRVTHFVGVLKEVTEEGEDFQSGSNSSRRMMKA